MTKQKCTSAKCDQCPLQDKPFVGTEGDPTTCKYVLVGEAPGHNEVAQGIPFVGLTGQILNRFLQRVGIKREDCFITNAVKCRLPTKTKKTKPLITRAVNACRPALLAELKQVPKSTTICLMGAYARDSLYPAEASKGILAARGWRSFYGYNIYVMAHPAYTMYNLNEAPMLRTDLRRLKRGRLKPPQVTPHVLDSLDKVRWLIEGLRDGSIEHGKYVAFDIETDQVDYQRDRLLCLSISPHYGTAYIIPDKVLYKDHAEFVTTEWSKERTEGFLGSWKYLLGKCWEPDPEAVALLSELFALPDIIWVGHNLKFDLRFLMGQFGMEEPTRLFDTIVAHYTLDERSVGHSLKALGDDYFDSGDYESELFNHIAKKSGRYSRVPRKTLYQYNAMDTELTLRLAYSLEKELKQQGLFEKPFLFPMMAAIPMLLNAELLGINIDWEEFQRIDDEELEPELQLVADELREISGHPELNPLSSVRVNDILYDEYKFPIIEVRTRAAGKRIKARSSQIAVMDGWAKMWELKKLNVTPRAWKFATRLRYYRHLRKMRGSYIRKWQGLRGTDHRVHTSYWLRGTVTGRLSAKEPPVQTIPSKEKDKWGVLVSNAHISKEGWSLVYADFSQAELMTAACLSSDEFMLESFRGGGIDYHSEVARAAYGENFTRDDRQACKRITFGWLFGGNVYEIATKALQFEGPVARRFASEWDDLFKDLIAWRKRQGELMIKQGYVESVFGRRRRFLLLTDKNVGKAKRIAINAPIQSAVSDLNLVSAIRLYDHYKNSDYAHVILLIHDSLVMEVRDDKVPEVRDAMEQTMLAVAKEYFPRIPFRADTKVDKKLGNLT